MELPVSSVKGRAGTLDCRGRRDWFSVRVPALQHGVLLPTAGLVDPDPACALRHIVGGAQEGTVRAALVNAGLRRRQCQPGLASRAQHERRPRSFCGAGVLAPTDPAMPAWPAITAGTRWARPRISLHSRTWHLRG